MLFYRVGETFEHRAVEKSRSQIMEAVDLRPETVLLDENGGFHQLPAPKGTLVNAVGAGDSMVAGFVAGWIEKQDYEHAFRMGISAGSASAFSELLATEAEIRQVYASIEA